MKIRLKHVIFTLLPAILVMLCVELVLRSVYYQQKSSHSFAISQAISEIREYILKIRVQQRIAQTVSEIGVQNIPSGRSVEDISKDIKRKLYDALYNTEEGKPLLRKFQKEYEQEFSKLVEEANKIRTKLLVLYIPSAKDENAHVTKVCRDYYTNLATKYHIDYLDLTEGWYAYPIEYTTLLPENGHLSRFGNHRVVEKLSEYIDRHTAYRSSVTFDRRPALFGDLAPNMNKIWNIIPEMPYRVITNKQGLRNKLDVTFPKQQQRILVLGDSFTFGPYLPNWHCIPNLLNKKYADKEILNAGRAGYTVTDEVSLFIERAKYVEPDITILQVLDNDLYGLFYFKKNEFDRKGRQYEASKEERALIETVTQQYL